MTDLATFLLVFLVGSYLLGVALTGLELLERGIRLILRQTKWLLAGFLMFLAGACSTQPPTSAVPNCPAPYVMTREACKAYADSVAGVH